MTDPTPARRADLRGRPRPGGRLRPWRPRACRGRRRPCPSRLVPGRPTPRSRSWVRRCPCSTNPSPVVEPPSALKGRIMAAAAADLEARQSGARRAAGRRARDAGRARGSRGRRADAVPERRRADARAARKTSPATWVGADRGGPRHRAPWRVEPPAPGTDRRPRRRTSRTSLRSSTSPASPAPSRPCSRRRPAADRGASPR